MPGDRIERADDFPPGGGPLTVSLAVALAGVPTLYTVLRRWRRERRWVRRGYVRVVDVCALAQLVVAGEISEADARRAIEELAEESQ